MNDLHRQAQNELKHLIAEGMVKQVPGGYRLKTERELEEEMALLDTKYSRVNSYPEQNQ